MKPTGGEGERQAGATPIFPKKTEEPIFFAGLKKFRSQGLSGALPGELIFFRRAFPAVRDAPGAGYLRPRTQKRRPA